ncbi:NUDIX domain-containing protein [Alkaliphilus sp. MSJ-5]|uniref:NUDIX domain-containing protein n=1 Tax=Alkaliphilus flagellatus TaxID=2841507 RepID=A0ABS6G3A5_9FIRM|nr:NUDIX domain-containing protein [Alkaliphilus flagellatus]MBU5676848.1 NUDIX domain-containing protein [Alkaliphilus flagellatus]
MLRNMTAIYIMFKNKMLLLYRVGSRVVQPSWCGIGGHFEKDELNDPKACVLRELFEETGITENDIGTLKLKYIALRMKNNEIRQNYYYFTELHNTGIDINKCDEGTLEWVDINEVLDREMPFTAKECLRHYLSIGKDDNKLYAGVTTENGVNFIELKEF